MNIELLRKLRFSNEAIEWLRKLESRSRNGDKGFGQIIEMNNILCNGKSFQTAKYEVAQKYNTTESTINAVCTRRLGLTAKEFVNLSKYPNDFKNMLKKKFPSRSNEIDDLLK